MSLRPHIKSDRILFTAAQVDLAYSPIKDLEERTFVLGAFNPGLCRLPNGNLLMMVRVAEALLHAEGSGCVKSIRWEDGYVIDLWQRSGVEMDDPRSFKLKDYGSTILGLTSLSWLLPVELYADGTEIKRIHYDKIISPQYTSQEYGIEDPRISCIGNRYYMTVCCVSSERCSTMLYVSDNGLDYTCQGIVLDHQNKDMVLFEGMINGKYYALTRPLGENYFATPPASLYHPGAAIHLASSPDLLHWKPNDTPFIRARRSSVSNKKIGGGPPPVLTPEGWLILYHGVEHRSNVGIYRTFWVLADRDDPTVIIKYADEIPLIEADPKLSENIPGHYLADVVFSTGIADHGNNFIIASGELDLACRISTISKNFFKR